MGKVKSMAMEAEENFDAEKFAADLAQIEMQLKDCLAAVRPLLSPLDEPRNSIIHAIANVSNARLGARRFTDGI